MRLLLDEDSGSKDLARFLRADGHDVERAIDVPLLGTAAPDLAVFAYATKQQRAILTKNAADYVELADASPWHPGILCLYYLDDGGMLLASAVAKAVCNISNTYPTCENLILSINEHQW